MLNVVIMLLISHYYFFSIFVSFTCASIVRLVLGQIIEGGNVTIPMHEIKLSLRMAPLLHTCTIHH